MNITRSRYRVVTTRTTTIACFVILACLIYGRGAFAQELFEPGPRQGYFLGGGLRLGPMGTSADDSESIGGMMGQSITLRLGEVATDWIGFGLSLTSGSGTNEVWESRFGGLMIDVQFIPFQTKPFSVHVGAGIGGISIKRRKEVDRLDDDPDGALSALFSLGANYDLFPFYDQGDGSGGFAVSFFVDAQILPDDEIVTGAVFAGVEVTYWFGFSKEKLKLDQDEAYRR